jgi:hypothetical protein
MTHWFPTFFMMGMLTMPLLPMVSTQLFFTALTGFLLYMTAIAVFAYRTTRLISVAMLAIPSALLQLVGYGLGFLTEKLKIIH